MGHMSKRSSRVRNVFVWKNKQIQKRSAIVNSETKQSEQLLRLYNSINDVHKWDEWHVPNKQRIRLFDEHKKKFGSFPFVPPQLSGRILFAPPDARALFLQNNLLCHGTCSVTGGAKRTGGGGHKRNRSKKSIGFLLSLFIRHVPIIACVMARVHNCSFFYDICQFILEKVPPNPRSPIGHVVHLWHNSLFISWRCDLVTERCINLGFFLNIAPIP